MARFEFSQKSSFGTDLLYRDGPLLEVVITAPLPYVQYLQQEGLPSFPTVSGLALIDTGASISVLEADVMDELGIPALERFESWTTHGRAMSGVYNASVSFPSLELPGMPLRRVLGGHVRTDTYYSKDVIMLVGRDILRYLNVTFDGPQSRLVIET